MDELGHEVEHTLERLAAPADELRPEWADVLRRAQRARRRSVAALAGAVVTAALVSSAFAVVPQLLKPDALAFMRSVRLPETGAPKTVRAAFAAHRYAGIPRRAVRIQSSRGLMTLWVSPHRGGGWCEGLQARGQRFWVTCHWWRREFGAFAGTYAGPDVFSGRAAVGRGRELWLLFQDGASIHVPTRNGFYLYRPPTWLLVRTAPRALVIRDSHGQVARERVPNPYEGGLLTRLVGPLRVRPGGVDRERERVAVERPTSAGPASIHVAPSKLRPATCSWLQIGRMPFGGGCFRRDRPAATHWRVTPLRVHVHRREVRLVWGHVGRDYRALELRFQDGRVSKVSVRDGFFLHILSRAEWARGHRPYMLVGRRLDGGSRRTLLFVFTWAR